MLVQEVLSRNLRDRRAVARYAGLTVGARARRRSRRGDRASRAKKSPRFEVRCSSNSATRPPVTIAGCRSICRHGRASAAMMTRRERAREIATQIRVSARVTAAPCCAACCSACWRRHVKALAPDPKPCFARSRYGAQKQNIGAS